MTTKRGDQMIEDVVIDEVLAELKQINENLGKIGAALEKMADAGVDEQIKELVRLLKMSMEHGMLTVRTVERT